MSDWRDEAACLNDPIPFDEPDPQDRGIVKTLREAEAKKICNTKCYVREECLEDALKDETPAFAWHIRGGLTGDERKVILRKRAKERDRQKKREKRLKEKREKEMAAA